MNRREFTKLSLLGSAGLITGCEIFSSNDSHVPTLELTNDSQAIKKELDGSFGLIKDLITNGEEQIKVNYPTETGQESLTFSFVDNNAAGYTHLRLQQDNGEVANVLWDQENLLPAVKFTDDEGYILEKDGQSLSFGFDQVVDNFDDLTEDGLLELAWKFVAIGLVVWLGTNIAGAIITALAFLAFNAFVLGAVIIAVQASVSILEWLAEHTGWSETKIEEFFDAVIIVFQRFVGEVTQFIESNS